MTNAAPSPQVELFTQRHCAPCRQVEAFLVDRGIDFAVRRVDQDPAALEELTERGFMSTPVTRVGDEWIVGFKRGALTRALKRTS